MPLLNFFIPFAHKPYLLFALFFFTSFASLNNKIDEGKDAAGFYATIDGKPFMLREDQVMKGVVMNKAGSIDGRMPARTIISSTFNGPTYDIAEGRLFNENIQFELGYEPDKTGTLSYYSLAIQYQSAIYYSLKEESKLQVSQFDWESDKKHFHISATYDCKLRSWGYPADNKKDINLKGYFNNVRITVPSWVTARN